MKKIRFKLSTEKVSALIFFVFAFLFPMYSTLYQVDNFSNFYITVLVSFSIVLTHFLLLYWSPGSDKPVFSLLQNKFFQYTLP